MVVGVVKGMAGWGRRTGPPSASLRPAPAQRAPRAPPPTVPSRALQEAALHTQLHPHAPVPVLHASRREHLRQGRGSLLGHRPRRGRAPHRGRAARHRPGTAATRRRRRLRECPAPAARACPPWAPRHRPLRGSPTHPHLSPATTRALRAAHVHPLHPSNPCCLGLCESPPRPACTFIDSPASAQAPNHPTSSP